MLNNMTNTPAAIEEHIRHSIPPEFGEMMAKAFLTINRKGLRVLHLTLKKHWYDMIESGEKREEYRAVTKYWNARLCKKYDVVLLRNGYRADSRKMMFEVRYVSITHGHEKWGAPEFDEVFCIGLGKRIDLAATAETLQE